MDPKSEPANCSEVLSAQEHCTEPMEDTRVLDCTDTEHLSVAIVEAVSAISGVDPCELDTRLYDVVDPDALRRTIQSGGPEMQVSFKFDAYHVSVFGNGEIAVTDPSADDPE